MNQLSHMQVLCICKIGFELNASAVASCGATAAGRLRFAHDKSTMRLCISDTALWRPFL